MNKRWSKQDNQKQPLLICKQKDGELCVFVTQPNPDNISAVIFQTTTAILTIMQVLHTNK